MVLYYWGGMRLARVCLLIFFIACPILLSSVLYPADTTEMFHIPSTNTRADF